MTEVKVPCCAQCAAVTATAGVPGTPSEQQPESHTARTPLSARSSGSHSSHFGCTWGRKCEVFSLSARSFGRLLFIFGEPALFLRSGFPSSMQPPVLAGVLTNRHLKSFGIFRSNPFKRFILISPLFRHYKAGDFNLKKEPVADSAADANTNRQIILYG